MVDVASVTLLRLGRGVVIASKNVKVIRVCVRLDRSLAWTYIYDNTIEIYYFD